MERVTRTPHQPNPPARPPFQPLTSSSLIPTCFRLMASMSNASSSSPSPSSSSSPSSPLGDWTIRVRLLVRAGTRRPPPPPPPPPVRSSEPPLPTLESREPPSPPLACCAMALGWIGAGWGCGTGEGGVQCRKQGAWRGTPVEQGRGTPVEGPRTPVEPSRLQGSSVQDSVRGAGGRAQKGHGVEARPADLPWRTPLNDREF